MLIPLSEADRLLAGTPRQPQPLPDLTNVTGLTHPCGRVNDDDGGHAGCGRRPFTCLPVTPGVIGTHHTLGDAAGRFLLCAADLTAAIITTGNHAAPTGDRMLAALLGAAPCNPWPSAAGNASRPPRNAKHWKSATAAESWTAAASNLDTAKHSAAGFAGGRCPHREPGWAGGGATNLDDLALLRWPHHTAKSATGNGS